jgi:hypothetical protein
MKEEFVYFILSCLCIRLIPKHLLASCFQLLVPANKRYEKYCRSNINSLGTPDSPVAILLNPESTFNK